MELPQHSRDNRVAPSLNANREKNGFNERLDRHLMCPQSLRSGSYDASLASELVSCLRISSDRDGLASSWLWESGKRAAHTMAVRGGWSTLNPGLPHFTGRSTERIMWHRGFYPEVRRVSLAGSRKGTAFDFRVPPRRIPILLGIPSKNLKSAPPSLRRKTSDLWTADAFL